jgi:acetylornithine deacetylase/succinyl-diaminopimelate desuccinylase-like protein
MSTISAGEVAELMIALIRNACVNDGTPDSGGEERSAATLIGYLGEPDARYEPHPGRTSLLYRIPGTTPGAPSIMLLGHTDVVPVTAEAWTHDPFAGEREDGFIWGRGTVDMLNQTAAMAAVLRRYRSGAAPPLPGDLLFLAVADEEAAGALGSGWITAHHWEDVECSYLISEIAAPALTGSRERGLPVTVAEKGPMWRRLVSRGIPGHGSQPYGTSNALVPLTAALCRLAAAPPPAEVTPQWRRFVEAWDPPGDLRERLTDPGRIDAAVDELAGCDMGFARWVHACTHLTVSPNTFHGGVKANVVPDVASAEIDIRVLPGRGEESVQDHLRDAIGPELAEQVHIEPVVTTPANESEPEGPLWESIGDAARSIGGADLGLLPILIPVATDARYFRSRGTTAYGVGLLDARLTFGEVLSLFHGTDERVSEASLGLTVELYRRMLERFGDLTG